MSGNGAVWTPVVSGVTTSLFAIWGTSNDDVWAAGSGTTIQHCPAGGNCVSEANPAPSENVNAIWGTSATDIWAVNNFGDVLHSDGATWTIESHYL
jgi:hypothetical protein